MATTLDRLRQEHRDHKRLIDILEAELSAFDAAKAPDFEIMAAIADYFLGYPASCHHPKEDLVYRALLARRPDCAGTVDDVEAEHRTNAGLVRHFAEAVTNVLRDAEISREAFDHVVRQFVEAQRRHIDREETSLFPLAAEALTDDDWAAIDNRVADTDDPLFGTMPEKRFAALRRDIEEWESARFT